MNRWSIKDTNSLKELREKLGDIIINRPQYPDVIGDRKFIRFLRRNAYDIDKTVIAITNFLQWRDDHNIDSYRHHILYGQLDSKIDSQVDSNIVSKLDSRVDSTIVSNIDSLVDSKIDNKIDSPIDSYNYLTSDNTYTHLTIEQLASIWRQRIPNSEIIFLSADKNFNTELLLSRLVNYMPLGPKYFPSELLSNRGGHFFTCERIRETIFRNYKDEISYSCEVEVVSFKESFLSIFTRIEANIIVSRSTQKPIVIGEGGQKLEQVTTKAREELEEFLQSPVILTLLVKVDEDWRSKDDALVKYGYKDSDM